MTNATANYRQESDPIKNFLTEVTVAGEELSVKASVLFEEYENWGGTLNQTNFGREMSNRGFERKRRTTGYFYFGLNIRSSE